MNAIVSIIQAHQGEFYESAGLVFGFFAEPAQAVAAMTLIISRGYAVARCGSQITIEK